MPSQSSIHEFLSLNKTLGCSLVCVFRSSHRYIKASSFLGEALICDVSVSISDTCAQRVTINKPLPARQQRYLSQRWGVEVLDRTELLLSLFEARAQSAAGKLQVALAKLFYQMSKLVKYWTHLERQKGGIGMRGGPGEKQIELDRRMLRDKIFRTKKRLAVVQKTRELNLHARRNKDCLTVALVGYTNAGKSTLFNQLTQAQVLAEDLLFATLDPTSRRMMGSTGVPVVLTDTVGFIQDMPEPLEATFHATLVEVTYCDLILHVIDASDETREAKMAVVEQSLRQLAVSDKPQWLIMNKIDMINSQGPITAHDSRFYLSALDSDSLEALRSAIIDHARQFMQAR